MLVSSLTYEMDLKDAGWGRCIGMDASQVLVDPSSFESSFPHLNHEKYKDFFCCCSFT